MKFVLGFLNIFQSAGQLPTSWKDPITIATLVIAASGMISLLVTVLMLGAMRAQTRITREIFEESHRPYVGVTSLDGGMDRQADETLFCWLSVDFKNVGAVPAYGVTTSWKISLGGEIPQPPALPSFDLVPPKSLTMFPNDTKSDRMTYILDSVRYKYLTQGRGVLEITAVIEYRGVTDKRYVYTQHGIHNPPDQPGYVMTEAEAT